jgi:gamma-glutamyltranspeptidase/glutathione hydrolase
VLFEPAIEYAESGFPVSPLVAARWASAARSYPTLPSIQEDRAWFDTFTLGGKAPLPGERWSSPHTARTLRILADSGVDDLYRGALAKRIEEFAAKTGGFLTRQDLEGHTSTWVEPISVEYRGHEIWELPANTNGIIPLSALAILDGISLSKYPRESAAAYHSQIEAVKLAFADAESCVADPDHLLSSSRNALEHDYIVRRRALITERAAIPECGLRPQGGTVYICAADADGMMVSFIQSNYSGPLLGFGSGVVIPETGIALHSRAAAFSLDPESPNLVGPGKRPAHTLIPAFITQDGRPVGAFGVMGGPMQPQGHVQLMVNQLEYGMNPQTSIDAPRWQWLQDLYVDLESSVPEDVASGLQARGHSLTRSGAWDVATAAPRRTPAGKFAAYGDFGKAQMVCRRNDGTYVVGSESRSDGGAVGY